jgi:hypothetical protein
MWGTRRFATRDDSRNNWWIALIGFGEGWHNNHHAHPYVLLMFESLLARDECCHAALGMKCVHSGIGGGDQSRED